MSYPPQAPPQPGGRSSYRPLCVCLGLTLFFIVAGCIEPPSGDAGVTAHVSRVRDGDSILVLRSGQTLEVRLHGIDAPEYDQPYGKDARAALAAFLGDKEVHLEVLDTDRYSRKVARVYRSSDGQLANLHMLAEGHAWVFQRYEDNKVWLQAQEDAKSRGKGLWAARNPVPPWQWRERP